MTSPATNVRPIDVVAVGVRWSRRIVVISLALVLLATELPQAAHDLVHFALIGVGLLAGLPHGSIDHRIAARLTGRSMIVVAAVYAALAALTWVLLVIGGLIILLPVLVLSLLHFALGELEVVRATTNWQPSRSAAGAVAVAGTGALLLPLARSGPQLAEVASSISPSLGVLLSAPSARLGMAAVWTVAAVIAGVAAVRARHRGVVLDLMLIGALGVLAPPLVAFAIWFGGWHSLRHCTRLLLADERSAAQIAAGQVKQALKILGREALLPSLAAVIVLTGLLALTLRSADPAAAVGGTLLVLLALTVPHMVVVLWLDQKQAQHG